MYVSNFQVVWDRYNMWDEGEQFLLPWCSVRGTCYLYRPRLNSNDATRILMVPSASLFGGQSRAAMGSCLSDGKDRGAQGKP